MTTKTVQQLMQDGLRLIGIDRRGNASRIACPTTKQSEIELTHQPDWNAWSIRLANGPYQQLCVFEPSETNSELFEEPVSERLVARVTSANERLRQLMGTR
jgi:hypothetical protein